MPEELATSEGYAFSKQKRKRIEQGFGWGKLIGPIRHVMVRGIEKIGQVFVMTMAAYNLVCMRALGQVRLQGGAMSARYGEKAVLTRKSGPWMVFCATATDPNNRNWLIALIGAVSAWGISAACQRGDVAGGAVASAQHQHRNVRVRQHLLRFAAQQQSFDAFATM